MRFKRVMTLDIGRRNIHVVIGKSKPDTLEIDKWFVIPTPEGSVKDGNLTDRSAIAFAINHLIKENHLTVRHAIVTVKSTQVITRELTVPNVSDIDLLPLALLDMEQYVPNIAKDYRTGVTILDKGLSSSNGNSNGNGNGNGNNGFMKVRVFAMPNTMADAYLQLLKDLNLKPLALDAHANALNKMVTRCYQTSQGKADAWNWKSVAFIDLGSELTEISILNQDKLLFNRQVQYGSSFVDAELIRQLGLEESNLNAKKAQWCDLAKQDFEQEDVKRFNDIMRLYASRVANEIQTVIQFYSGRTIEKRPDAVVLYGGNAQTNAIAPFIQQILGIPVKIFDLCPAVFSTNRQEHLNLIPVVNACAALCRND